eukprot:CAMPEP_0194174726 /NCGR_PEP_ID=MMETSP0154-20130528/8884_1 /TAXON_ID=1049557 /ORGANISM="Thalassiothrix antarctica, Strain L6-D1" /LENGTH=266 /DNA_ID=CAMNT_0038888281 /DNA_START=324 /DNA_END=1124 /DNA_ORIENTATION=+
MWLSVCLTQKRYEYGHYVAALIMCAGLIQLTRVDSFSTNHQSKLLEAASGGEIGSSSSEATTTTIFGSMALGPLLLGISTVLDAVVPNLQERLFTTCETDDVMFLSNIYMFLVSFAYSAFSGELSDAINYCWKDPEPLFILCLQGVCAYIGLEGYLSVIHSHGGVAAIILANARKVFTVILSFSLFQKTIDQGHVIGLCFIALGVFLGFNVKEIKPTKRRSSVCPLGGGDITTIPSFNTMPSQEEEQSDKDCSDHGYSDGEKQQQL